MFYLWLEQYKKEESEMLLQILNDNKYLVVLILFAGYMQIGPPTILW